MLMVVVVELGWALGYGVCMSVGGREGRGINPDQNNGQLLAS